MKSVVFTILTALGAYPLFAQTETTTNAKSKNQVIVIQDPLGNPSTMAIEPKVESGTDQIVGGLEDSIKGARRTWDQACQAWKNEMKQLNGKNLIQASCGAPALKTEVHQSQKSYLYQSTGKFKVRVSGK